MDENRTLDDVVYDEILKKINKLDSLELGSEEHARATKDIKIFMDQLNAEAEDDLAQTKLEVEDERKTAELSLRSRELDIREKELENKEAELRIKKVEVVNHDNNSKIELAQKFALGAIEVGANVGLTLLAQKLLRQNFIDGLMFEDQAIFSSTINRENRSNFSTWLRNRI